LGSVLLVVSAAAMGLLGNSGVFRTPPWASQRGHSIGQVSFVDAGRQIQRPERAIANIVGGLVDSAQRQAGFLSESLDSSSRALSVPDTAGVLEAIRVCNATAPVPQVSQHRWALADGWQRSCEQKNAKESYPYERNWCWVGVKQMCHWNLKAHKSWSEFHQMAARDGIAPPVADSNFQPLEHPELCDRPEHGRSRAWTAEENATAREWFRNNVAVYVISLPTSDDRWKMIKGRLESLEIWATRVYGVDMRETKALEKAKRNGFVPQFFNFTRAQDVAYEDKHAMGSILGTLGCAAAHFKVQEEVIAGGSPLAVVMEDDTWPAEDFVQRLWSLVHEELPCDWEVTTLLSRCGYGKCVAKHLMRVQPDINEPAWRCHQGVNWGMHAVLYRTALLAKLQVKWKSVVFDEARPHCMDVDVALASISDQVGYYAVPAVQDPGFVAESNHRSARWDINQAARTSTTQTTSSLHMPTMKPGEPWPGAWSYG
jgi:GR25 family glycosyltransferase involved in LPS biosynthesis